MKQFCLAVHKIKKLSEKHRNTKKETDFTHKWEDKQG